MIYLDNAATTRLCAEAREAWLRYSCEDFGNPSSVHRAGIAAERGLRHARETLARALGGEPAEIALTSGGTEADALAVIGAARASRRRHVVASAIEHPAVIESLKILAAEGFRTTLVPVSSDGLVDPERVAAEVGDDTVLVSVMHVNNEIGTLEPIEEIAAAVRRASPETLVHVDAVQSLGKVALSVRSLGADLVSISAHKLHGPKGVGALWRRQSGPGPRVRLRPFWGGGGQEGGARPGTENVAGAAAFAAAAEVAVRELPEAGPRMARLRDRLVERVRAGVPDMRVVGHALRRAPHNANLGFRGVRAEVLLHAIEERGVYVSAGAACASREKGPSHVLRAIGLPDDVGTIRATLSRETTEAEIDAAALAIVESVRALAASDSVH